MYVILAPFFGRAVHFLSVKLVFKTAVRVTVCCTKSECINSCLCARPEFVFMSMGGNEKFT